MCELEQASLELKAMVFALNESLLSIHNQPNCKYEIEAQLGSDVFNPLAYSCRESLSDYRDSVIEDCCEEITKQCDENNMLPEMPVTVITQAVRKLKGEMI
jgi:hypothetical protein